MKFPLLWILHKIGLFEIVINFSLSQTIHTLINYSQCLALKITHLCAHSVCNTCCKQMQTLDNWSLGLCVFDCGCWVHCQIMQRANSTYSSCVNIQHRLKHWKYSDLKQLQMENYKYWTSTTTRAKKKNHSEHNWFKMQIPSAYFCE